MLKCDPVIKLQEWERRVEQKNSPQEDRKIYLKGGEGEQDNRSERMGRNKSKAHYTLQHESNGLTRDRTGLCLPEHAVSRTGYS